MDGSRLLQCADFSVGIAEADRQGRGESRKNADTHFGVAFGKFVETLPGHDEHGGVGSGHGISRAGSLIEKGHFTKKVSARKVSKVVMFAVSQR